MKDKETKEEFYRLFKIALNQVIEGKELKNGERDGLLELETYVSQLEQEAERRGYEKCKEEMEINTLGKLLDAKDTLYKDNITYLASYTSGYYRAIEDLIKLYKLSNKEVGERLKNYCKLKLLEEENGKQSAR